MEKDEFERLYLMYEASIKRYAYYKLPSKADGDDENILHLFYIDNMSQSEISKRLGIPVGTVKNWLYPFLDADDFLPNWGFGEDNCGNEVNLVRKGIINREGNKVTSVPALCC